MRFDKLDKVENFMGKIKAYLRDSWFPNQTATWDENYQPEFTEILTRRGYGFAFNMLPESQLFTKE